MFRGYLIDGAQRKRAESNWLDLVSSWELQDTFRRPGHTTGVLAAAAQPGIKVDCFLSVSAASGDIRFNQQGKH